jgi:hypothetical protein
VPWGSGAARSMGASRAAVAAAVVVVTGGIAGAVLVAGGGGGDPGTANLWISDTVGNHPCTREATGIAFDVSKSCDTFLEACASAQAGDVVYFESGTYPGEVIFRDAVAGQATSCNKGSQTTFAVPAGQSVEFTGTWMFGDFNTGANGIDGPPNLKLMGWDFRLNDSDGDKISTFEVPNMLIDDLRAQQFDVTGRALATPTQQNMVIQNSEFSGCFGTLGITRIACITRTTDASGITWRDNVWHDYHTGEGTGCTPGVTCPRGVGNLVASTISAAVQSNVKFERNRFYNITITPIRVQPRNGGVINGLDMLNNWFGCSDPGDVYSENVNGSVALDNPIGGAPNILNDRFYGNTMCSGISGLGAAGSEDFDSWGAGSEFKGNITIQGGKDDATVPAPQHCDADLVATYNIRMPFRNEGSYDGEWRCDSTETLLPYSASGLTQFVVGPTWGASMNLSLKSETTIADNAWLAASCAVLPTDYFESSRPLGTNCEIGSHERNGP